MSTPGPRLRRLAGPEPGQIWWECPENHDATTKFHKACIKVWVVERAGATG